MSPHFLQRRQRRESTSGTTPAIKANEVIRIGRRRRRDASSTAVMALRRRVFLGAGKLDNQNGVLAASRPAPRNQSA